ncbi:hypothetical protein [Streptomyces sp. NBC_00483]|uniref:hypothetical protein n=1 Tax=Streptomyces sp. NBC_00483 TaxID=2975756 RepID=UPI002E19EF59
MSLTFTDLFRRRPRVPMAQGRQWTHTEGGPGEVLTTVGPLPAGQVRFLALRRVAYGARAHVYRTTDRDGREWFVVWVREGVHTGFRQISRTAVFEVSPTIWRDL